MAHHIITDWDEFIVELQTTRQRGWSTNFEEGRDGVHGLAVPIQGREYHLAAVLAIAAPAAWLPRSKHVEVLRHMFDTANAISQTLETPRRQGKQQTKKVV